MGLFAESVGTAKAAQGGNWGKEGRHLVLLNSGKMDVHAGKKNEQVIFEGTIIHILDPGPPAGQRWKPSGGGNESPHVVLDSFTFYFGAGQSGSEGRCKKLLLVAADMEESKVPPSINPATGNACPYPGGTSIDPATGNAVNPGTPGAIQSITTMTYALNMATNPSVNALRNTIIEVVGRGINTQGKGPGGSKAIVATDPIRKWYPSQVNAIWAQLDPKVQAELQREGRWQQMLLNEEKQRAAVNGPAAAPAPAPQGVAAPR